MKTLTKDLMTKNLISLRPTDSMLEAYRLMFDKHIRHLVIMENDTIVGILSDRDVLKAMHSNKLNEFRMELSLNSEQKISDYMNFPVLFISETTPIERVAEEILLQKVSAFMVQDPKGKVKGIITTEDLIGFLLITLNKLNQKAPTPIGEFILY